MVSAAAQSVAEPVLASAPKSTEQAAAEPAAQPAAMPTEPALVQPAATPVEKKAAQPDAIPVDQTGALPAALPVVASCPGNPHALGTSRVITVSPDEFRRIGTIQYRQTLPLQDHEVVLTFDDGPIPPYSNIILDTLDAQCVKVTYFMVGEMARAYPAIVRRIYNAGHTIGTHTQHHPFGFEHLSMQRVEREVDGGIASVDAALGDPKALSPFFRIPGLGRTNAIESFLADKKLVTWSADVDTNDWWRGTTPGQIVQRAMRRLNAKGRGILLMHDIHPATAMALPALLKELKSQGYHVVQVVPAGERPVSVPDLVASPAETKGGWPRLVKTSAISSDSEQAPPRHRLKKARMSHEPALRHRVKHALRHRLNKVLADHEPPRRHRLNMTLASKRRPAVADLPGRERAAGRDWQLGQF
jgi:peptidoglycan/xylan/chitin deacetylase (PgdA/CDA1 family)